MKRISFTLLMAYLAMVSVGTSVIAMTRADNTSQTKPDYDLATGFYGGIKNGKLLLILSEQGGLRYYSLPAGRIVLPDGRELSSLPKKTPIQVKIQSGKVVEVVVLGGGK